MGKTFLSSAPSAGHVAAQGKVKAKGCCAALDAALPGEAALFPYYLPSLYSLLLPILAKECPAGLEIFSLSLSCCFSSLWHKMSVLLKERCYPPLITFCGCCWGLRVTPTRRGPPRAVGGWGGWDAQSRSHPALWLCGPILGGKVELISPNGFIRGYFGGDRGGVRTSAPSLCPMALLSTWNTEIQLGTYGFAQHQWETLGMGEGA